MIDDWIANAYAGMSRRQFLAWMSSAGVALAGFAASAKSVAGEVITTPSEGLVTAGVTVSSGGFPVPVYEAYPAAAGKYPIVIVLPEIFGMHEHIKDVTRRFAKAGFFSVTFEPYARDGGVAHLKDIADVRKVADSAPDERVMADIDSLVAYAKKHPSARADRLGMTGFCRGGLYTFLYAARSSEVHAAVAWYGQLKPAKTPGIRSEGPIDVAARISAPVLGLYGEKDLGIPVADVREMEAALRKAGKTADFVIYPDAPHAFHADYRPSYRPDAAKDAWRRCVAWFSRYLGS